MRRVRTVLAATVVTAAALLPTMLASGDDNEADEVGQNWWAVNKARAGTANFQADNDLFTVCDEAADGMDVVGTVERDGEVVYTIVADGGSGDCERRHSGDGARYDLYEKERYSFSVCLSLMDRCRVKILAA